MLKCNVAAGVDLAALYPLADEVNKLSELLSQLDLKSLAPTDSTESAKSIFQNYAEIDKTLEGVVGKNQAWEIKDVLQKDGPFVLVFSPVHSQGKHLPLITVTWNAAGKDKYQVTGISAQW